MLDEAFDQPRAAATLMIGFDRLWCIAGGWAIDLAVGSATREHKDVEVAVFRKDQHLLRQYLREWNFSVVVSNERVDWRQGDGLQLPLHELHAAAPDGTKLEFLLNERDSIDWIYRRDPRVRRSIDKSIVRGREGIPVLAPEIVLLYKSKTPRPADELDFRIAREILGDESGCWLTEALRITQPGHAWLASLGDDKQGG